MLTFTKVLTRLMGGLLLHPPGASHTLSLLFLPGANKSIFRNDFFVVTCGSSLLPLPPIWTGKLHNRTINTTIVLKL